jgi:hypothetical protein
MGRASRNCETSAQAFVRLFAKILCDTLLTSPVGLAYITVIDGRGVAGGLRARLWELVLAGFWYGVPVCFFGFGGFGFGPLWVWGCAVGSAAGLCWPVV